MKKIEEKIKISNKQEGKVEYRLLREPRRHIVTSLVDVAFIKEIKHVK